MKLVFITMLATGLASAAFADHREPEINPGFGQQDSSLEYILEDLSAEAQNEGYEAQAARNIVLAQKYAKIADQAARMARNVSELNSGNVYDPERYFEDLRVKMYNIEQIARGIARLPYKIADLVQEARYGVDEITEGGGSIEFPGGGHGGGHGRGQYQATCDVTMVNSSTFSLSVSGIGRSANEAIYNAQDNAERQCRANRARCHFGRCDVQRLR